MIISTLNIWVKIRKISFNQSPMNFEQKVHLTQYFTNLSKKNLSIRKSVLILFEINKNIEIFPIVI